jgi:hypothetical protein
MNHPRVSNEDMQRRIVRWEDLKHQGIPVMFIDSPLERHQRMNYAVIGDTASENPEFKPAITVPHKFQIGIMAAPQGCGPAYHTHDYVEMFLVLRGRWRFYWGYEPDGEPMGEAILGEWDQITLPPGLYRGFESLEPLSVTYAVLDPHQVFTGKDPYWPNHVVQQAAAAGFQADERGKMVQPAHYAQVRDSLKAKLEPLVFKHTP